MSVWDKIDFGEFTGEKRPVDPKLDKLLKKSHNQLVRDEGLRRRNIQKTKLSDELVIAMKEYYNSDLSLVGEDVANKFGLSKGHTILVLQGKVKGGVGPEVRAQKEPMMTCSKCGVTTNKGNIIRYHNEKCINLDTDMVLQMYKDGVPHKVIKSKFNITQWKLGDIIRKSKNK